MYAMIAVNRENCLRCGTCVDVCPRATLEMGEDSWPAQPRPEDCEACGTCAQNCQGGAIRVEAGAGGFAEVGDGMILGRDAAYGRDLREA
jgi:adenylylsulfate reductase subunit B